MAGGTRREVAKFSTRSVEHDHVSLDSLICTIHSLFHELQYELPQSDIFFSV